MPINRCSINSFTINSLACRRRGIVQPPIPQPSSGQNAAQHYRQQNWIGRPEEEEIDVSKLEGANILVSVNLNGKTHETSVENSFTDLNFNPSISVKNIQLEIKTPEIKLLNLQIKKGKH